LNSPFIYSWNLSQINLVLSRINKEEENGEGIVQDLSIDGLHIEEITLPIKEKLGYLSVFHFPNFCLESFKLFTLSFNDCRLKSLNNLPKIQGLYRVLKKSYNCINNM